MKPKLTFLLSLTFLFLFSGSVYGIDFGKSEEEKYKGTNIGIHLCRKTNLDILKNSVLRDEVGSDLTWFKKEKIFIESRCLKKHEKKTETIDWIDTSDSVFSYVNRTSCKEKWDVYPNRPCKLPKFELRIKNNSKNKIITYISITVKHEDNQGKPSSYSYSQPWILPNNLFIDSEQKYETTVIKFFPKEERLDKKY